MEKKDNEIRKMQGDKNAIKFTKEEQDKVNKDPEFAVSHKGSLALVKAALVAGAEVNTEFEYGGFALHHAAHRNIAIINELLASGADVNASEEYNKRIALHRPQ